MIRRLLLVSAAVSALAGPAFAQEGPPGPSPLGPPVDVARSLEPAPPPPPLIDDATPAPADPAVLAAAEPQDPPEPYDPRPAPRDAEGRSVYGLFLAGRLAMALGEGELGADYLARAQALSPDQRRVREPAFTSALLSGDLDLAARLAPTGESSPVTVQAGRLVSAIRDLGAGRARQADRALAAQPIAFPHARAGALVAPWVAAAAGDWDRALAGPPAGADPMTSFYGRYYRALLLERRGRGDAAETELRALVADGQRGQAFRSELGALLERRGKRDEAIVVYDQAIAANPQDGLSRAAKTRVEAGGRPPQPFDDRSGAAHALTAAAAAALRDRVNEFAVLYLRLAIGLKPDDETRLLLAQALQGARMEEASRAELARITDADPVLYAAARQSLAISLDADDQDEAAIAEARRAVAARPADPAGLYALATLLTGQERFDEALVLLNDPRLNTAQQAWPVRFQRGAVLESLGRDQEAEAELWAALQAEPNRPEVLNYLGYLWVDHGTRVDQGAEMIARAVAAEPTNGNYQDSLGWARYRQGRLDEAVPILELAVSLEPGNAEINDHLGDAYFAAGREREARFQWRRVLTLDPDAERRAGVERKLENGLSAEERPGVLAPPATLGEPVAQPTA